ncbi:MAG: UDP-N-acetylglucosamine--N-acetylmuramyl-(pentapeptide) pyrophosphoryl-undecaprenol [Candidatus Sumerlaeota bacterium]|nr:UDP-N-acetylglucosamine--N-acetylmuramyl-(pentapeptide) pyrophosphoryl-undecaprenol [Candidatus Sumerlaeota bacterium]
MGTEHSRRVLIVAGGTGGHIAPALAVGNALRHSGEDVVVRYLTGSRQIERQAFAAAHEFPDFLACERAPRLSLSAAPELLRYARSWSESWGMLRRFVPHVILATGGYVCAPVLSAARLQGIPFFLHESNAVPGQVTRLFAKRARRVFVALDAAAERLDANATCEVVGTPVRREMLEATREDGLARFGFSANNPVLFVIGGSQGAHGVNEAVLDALAHIPPSLQLQVIWACGPLNHNTVKGQLDRSALPNVKVSLHPFLDDVHLAYAAADLVVSRAGASTLAEITARGLPSVLIPYPHAKDNHQWENAQALAKCGAALIVEEASLGSRRLATLLTDVLRSTVRRGEMAVAAHELGRPGCAGEIADWLLDQSAHDTMTPSPISDPEKLTA